MPTIICTGCSSGIGYKVITNLVQRIHQQSFPTTTTTTSTRWTIILGTRNTSLSTQSQLSRLVDNTPTPNGIKVDLKWFDLNLSSIPSTRQFYQNVKQYLDSQRIDRIDTVLLNAACWKKDRSEVRLVNDEDQVWMEEVVVNHFAQYYLVNLFLPYLTTPTTLSSSLDDPHHRLQQDSLINNSSSTTASATRGSNHHRRSRVIFTTSSLQNSIKNFDDLYPILSNSNSSSTSSPTDSTSISTWTSKDRYAASKLVQMIGFHCLKERLMMMSSRSESREEDPGEEEEHGRRDRVGGGIGEGAIGEGEGKGEGCGIDFVTVSPGFIPTTNLSRESPWYVRWIMNYVVYWFPFCSTEEVGAMRTLNCFPNLPPPSSEIDTTLLSPLDSPISTPTPPTILHSVETSEHGQGQESIMMNSPVDRYLEGQRRRSIEIPYYIDPEKEEVEGVEGGRQGGPRRTHHPSLKRLIRLVDQEKEKRRSRLETHKNGDEDERRILLGRWKELGKRWAPSLEEMEKW